MVYLLLVVGFLLLIKGADLFVEGSASLARIWKVPSLIIGLTIVAMGTSAPEASVSITAGLAGNNDIAIGNIVGSNIFNGMVVVGVCAMLAAFAVDRKLLIRDIPVSLGAALFLLFCMIDLQLSRLEGLILIVMMGGYLIWTIMDALSNRHKETAQEHTRSIGQSLLFIAVGLVMIIGGGNLVVTNASEIAQVFGVSQNLIALTIVAIGTSLPELVTSIVASRKGEHGLALGNAIGSNIFNILFILGMSAALSPIPVSQESIYDTLVLIVVTLMLLFFAATRKQFSKKEGLFCVLVYLIYTAYIIMR